MRKAIAGTAVVAALITLIWARPAAAVGPSFFASYVSSGAMVLNTGNPGDFSRGALLLFMFRPTDFTPAEAQAEYQVLAAQLTGGSIASFGPADIVALGVSPAQALSGIQQFFISDVSFSEFYVLDIRRRQPSGVAIDLYLFFSVNDYRYAVTLQF